MIYSSNILATPARLLQLIIGYSLLNIGYSNEALPISKSFWQSDAFVKSFNGSYRIEARIEPQVSTEERGLLVEVQKLMEDGKRKDALAKIKGSDLTEKSAALQYNMGNLHFEEGELEDAKKAYEKAIEGYPSFRRAHRNLALVLVREGELEKGLEHLLEALRLGDSDGTTYGMLGFCRLQKGEWASALQAYRMAQLVQPDSSEWKSGVAQCLQNLNEQEEAVALLDEVIRQRPSESSYATLQASIFIDLDQNDEAVKALELPRRLQTLEANGLLLLADLHLRGMRIDDALKVVEESFNKEIKPEEGRIVSLMETAMSMQQWELAESLIGKAMPEEGEVPRVLRRASARLDIKSGKNPVKGAEELQKLISEDPTDGVSLMTLADYMFSKESYDDALGYYERATALEESAADAWVGVARVRVEQRRYADALKAVDEALVRRPGGELEAYRASLADLVEASR